LRAKGLDGFSRGWVAVTLDGDTQAISFHRDVADALSGFDRAGIDIPIGMTADGERVCDQLARERLRPHGSRVFTGARRWLWQEYSDPDKANGEALRRGQKRVSRQLWHLGPKIMEVDAHLRARRSLDIREVHPELVFLRLNHDIERWLTVARIGTGAKRDDVLDACAAAIAAREPAGCLPERALPLDAHGLPMQIWF